MALPNTDPIYTKVGGMAGVEISAANTKSDGSGTIGTDIFVAATVDATNGGFVRDVTFYPTATTAATSTTATVGRVFASSATSGATTPTNTHPLGEVALAAQSADATAAATYPVVVPINRPLPPGWTILVTNHAAPAANTKWKAVVTYGAY
jgi:hypothetical protein